VAAAVAAAVVVARGLRSDGVLVSVRHGAIRISVGTYTTEREVDRLVASLRRHAPGHLPRAAPAGGGALPGASSKL
jgi:selenocysteine lyase/cysteine desulfurase